MTALKTALVSRPEKVIDMDFIDLTHPTRETLEAVFGVEAHYADDFDEDEECHTFPDGAASAICTSWAKYVRRCLGARAEIFGFHEEGNPTSGIAEYYGGHDFAVVDGRWIVDGWISNVHSEPSAIFDLQSTEDKEAITRNYGEMSTWERCLEIEMGIDRESAIMRARAFVGTAFPEILALDLVELPSPRI